MNLQDESGLRPFPPGLRVVGLTGGIASGKSFVASVFAELGAALLDADRAGHAVLESAEVVDALVRRWGDEILRKDGTAARAEIARRVFHPVWGAREHTFLESLTHPRIAEQLLTRAEEGAKAGKSVAVLDAALLFEAGWNRFCSLICFVDAPRSVRLARAMERGWSEKDFTDRECAQFSVDFKRERADEVIDNSGSLDYVQSQVERLWHARLGTNG
jgi:dephospho-CoA kinase